MDDDELKLAWRQSQRKCWLCNKTWACDLHHVERRSHGSTADQPCNWFAACRECHDGPLAAKVKHPEQLCLKMLADPMHFSLERWLRIADPELRAPCRVTFHDILAHVGKYYHRFYTPII